MLKKGPPIRATDQAVTFNEAAERADIPLLRPAFHPGQAAYSANHRANITIVSAFYYKGAWWVVCPAGGYYGTADKAVPAKDDAPTLVYALEYNIPGGHAFVRKDPPVMPSRKGPPVKAAKRLPVRVSR